MKGAGSRTSLLPCCRGQDALIRRPRGPSLSPETLGRNPASASVHLLVPWGHWFCSPSVYEVRVRHRPYTCVCASAWDTVTAIREAGGLSTCIPFCSPRRGVAGPPPHARGEAAAHPGCPGFTHAAEGHSSRSRGQRRTERRPGRCTLRTAPTAPGAEGRGHVCRTCPLPQ